MSNDTNATGIDVFPTDLNNNFFSFNYESSLVPTVTTTQQGVNLEGTNNIDKRAALIEKKVVNFLPNNQLTLTDTDLTGSKATKTEDLIIGEYGRIPDLNHNYQTVILDHSFENPVIFLQVPSYNGYQEGIARITNIESDRFNVFFQEPDYLDGYHALEQVSYLVLEAGTWQIDDDTVLEVGTVNSQAIAGTGASTHQWTEINFNQNFEATPVVFTQVQTNNETDLVYTRQRRTNNNGFELTMQEVEAKNGTGHALESIGWMAISSGKGNWNEKQYEVGLTEDNVTHNWYQLDFAQSYSQAPQLFANIADYDGADPSGLRYQSLGNNGVQVMVQEEQSSDAEILHTTEKLSYFILEGEGLLSVKTEVEIPEVSLNPINLTLKENGEEKVITVNRTDSLDKELTVNYAVSGTATNGEDYDSLNGILTFAAGSSTAVINVNLIDDNEYEGEENITITLSADDSYQVGNNKTLTMAIADNDPYQPVGNSLILDGKDNYFSHFLDVPETEVTHEFWFKTIDENGGLFSITDNVSTRGGHDRHIYLENGNIKARIWNHEIISSSGLNLADNKWHHVAHVFGNSVGGQQLYVNGQLVAFGTKTESNFDWQSHINIGYSVDAKNDHLQGQMDEVRVWNVAKTQAEIQASMNQQLKGNEDNLIAYWDFDNISTKANQWNVGFINRNADNIFYSYDFTEPDAVMNFGSQNGFTYKNTPVETLTVDANKNVYPAGQPKVYSSVLEQGKRYKIEVSGQVLFAGNNTNVVADAAYYTANNWSTNGDSSGSVDLGLHSTALGNSDDKFWGKYNPDHVYTYELIGQGKAIDFYFNDSNYGDNSGTYTVKIYQESEVIPDDNVIRFNANFGEVNPAANIQQDYFAMQAWTRINLAEDKIYKITTESDDASRYFLRKVSNGEIINIVPSWQTEDIGEYYFNVNESGQYDFYVQGFEQTGNSAFNIELKETSANSLPNHLQLRPDINGDGKIDILWRNYSNGELGGWSMNGTQGTWFGIDKPSSYDPAWYVVATGDFNNDGHTDLVYRYHWVNNTGHNRIVFMKNNKIVDSANIERVADNNWHIVGTGDFNSDGNTDILWRNYATGDNHVWMMKGTGRESSVVLQNAGVDWKIVGTGDFNGDGKIDILWRNSINGQNSIWYMDGTTRTSVGQVQAGTDLNWQIMGTADFNNDGKSDIIWRNIASGANAVWLMDGHTRTDGIDLQSESNLSWRMVGNNPVSIWTAQFYNNDSLSGNPVQIEGFGSTHVQSLSQGWGNSAPANTPTDKFSARYTSTRYLSSGFYQVKTVADDGARVKIGDQWVVNKFNNFGRYAGFIHLDGGFYNVTTDYRENSGSAGFRVDIGKVKPISESVNVSTHWNATVFHTNGGQPSTNFYQNTNNRIATLNLGSNKGRTGLDFQDWGAGAIKGYNDRLPSDNFAIRAYTHTHFTAGRKYRTWVRSDDGYQLLAKNHHTKQWTYITPQNQWKQDAYGAWKAVDFTVNRTGWYDMHFHMYEGGGNSYFGLRWEDITPTGYHGNINSSLNSYFSNTSYKNRSLQDKWDRIGGDSAQFPGGNFTRGDLWQKDMPSDVYNIYKNLSNTIFGSVKAVNSGYVFDQGYYNGYKKWHAGLDIQASRGTSVKAAISGKVSWVNHNFMGIDSDDGNHWVYGHLGTKYVSAGQRISAGQLLAKTDSANHLHLEVQHGHGYKGTYGAHTNQNWLRSVTISPLQAYWQWRNNSSNPNPTPTPTPNPTPNPTPTPTPTPNPTPLPKPTPTPDPSHKLSITSIYDAEDYDHTVLLGKSVKVTGYSNTSNLKFFLGDRELGGNLTFTNNESFVATLNLPSDYKLGWHQIAVKNNNSGERVESNTAINLVTNTWYQIKAKKGYESSRVTFEKFQQGTGIENYIENKETWIIIHGLEGEAGDFKDLARAIEGYDGDWDGGSYQVLTVDWEAARWGIYDLYKAAGWIDTISEYIKLTIQSWGISPLNINLVGHSLGAYVAYEVSERLGGINKLVALNPASTTLGGYNHSQVDFNRHSTWSWSFWHNDITDNSEISRTANESFKLDLAFANPDEGHGGAKILWTNMLKNKNGGVSQYFGIDDIHGNNKPWYIGPGWEAEIVAIDNRDGWGDPNWVPSKLYDA
ncbi:MAG: FG-GAP-like repeat-containing protein [Crocosphaera sp.]